MLLILYDVIQGNFVKAERKLSKRFLIAEKDSIINIKKGVVIFKDYNAFFKLFKISIILIIIYRAAKTFSSINRKFILYLL